MIVFEISILNDKKTERYDIFLFEKYISITNRDEEQKRCGY